MTSPIDIRPQDLATVRLYLERTLPQTAKVYVFGSRANWTTKNGSDLDLAVDAGAPLPQRTMVELADAFEESDLPYKVDVVDLQTVAPDFGARIRAAMVPFPSGRALNSTVDTWRRCKLGDILELKRGYDLPTADRRPGRIPLVSSSGVSDHIADAKVPGPGVVTGRYGTIGEVYYLDEPFWPLNTTLYVRNFKGNDPRFISYLLKTLDFRAYSDKAAVPGLNRNHLHEAVVELPTDVEEQKAIAAILGAFDDKIELNRRMNETLEQTVRAIFKDWFVDFGPTRAKMEGRAPYLAPDIWSLFPDRLDDEGKPEGWKLRPYKSLIADQIGGDWGDETQTEEHQTAVRVVRGTDLKELESGTRGKVPRRFTDDRKLESRRLADLDIVVEVSGGSPTQPTGRSLLITASILERFSEPVTFATFCRRLRPLSLEHALIGSAHLRHLYAKGGTWEYQNQSTGISNFQTQHFLNSELVVWPGAPVATAFASIVEPMVRKSSSNESIALAATRDLLLPKLMSGEIRVRDAEKIVGEVA